MKKVSRRGFTKFVFGMAGAALLALPAGLLAGGVCEDLCGACYSDEQVECAYLDGCSKSKNECYFKTGECPECL